MISYLFLIISFFFQSLFADGFKDAQVLMPNGYSLIQNIKKGSKVMSMDFDGTIVEKEVDNVIRSHSDWFYNIVVEINGIKDVITAKFGQKFVKVSPDFHKKLSSEIYEDIEIGDGRASRSLQSRKARINEDWIGVQDLKAGDYLRTADDSVKITSIKRVQLESRQRYYKISVKDTNNFFISHHKILVHNFAVAFPVLAWGAGKIVFVALSALASALSLAFLNSALEKKGIKVPGVIRIDPENKIPTYHLSVNDLNFDKAIESKDKENSNSKGAEKENERKKTTPEERFKKKKENEKKARKEGWKETQDYEFDPHGQKVFEKDRRQISIDIDAHNGGTWKEFKKGKRGRIGTLDDNFNRIKD